MRYFTGMNDKTLRTRFLEELEPSKEKFHQLALVHEKGNTYLQAMNQANTTANVRQGREGRRGRSQSRGRARSRHGNDRRGQSRPRSIVRDKMDEYKKSNVCCFCGNRRTRTGEHDCPAKDQVCKICDKVGHFSGVCFSKLFDNNARNGRSQSRSTSANATSSGRKRDRSPRKKKREEDDSSDDEAATSHATFVERAQ